MQQIQKSSDVLTKMVVINRISDVHAGVSLVLSTLVAGNIVMQGTPLSAPVDGKRAVCKQAKILTGSTTTAFKVATITNQFKVGDILMQTTGGAAYAIIDVTDNGDGTTTLTTGTALESATAGTFIYQSSAAGADAGALSNVADVILKEAFTVPSNSQVIWMGDAFVRADVHKNYIGALYLATLKGVIEISY